MNFPLQSTQKVVIFNPLHPVRATTVAGTLLAITHQLL